MKRIAKLVSNFLYFLPAVINTLVVLWIFVYPWREMPVGIDVPVVMWLVLLLFWGSGLLLRFGKWYGGIPPAALSIYIYFDSQNSMQHIDWLPIAVVTVIYYILCGILTLRLKRK